VKFPVALFLASSLLTSGAASAAERGFFFGVGAGEFNTEVDEVWGSNYNFDEDDLGFKVFGGYTFLPWLAVEAAFIDGGSPQVSQTFVDTNGDVYSEKLTIAVQTIVASANFILPINNRFELFAKPGFAYWDSETSYRYDDPDPAFSFRDRAGDSGSAFFIGAGAAFHNGPMGLRIEYEWFDVAPEYDSASDEFVDELDASAGFLSLSATYRF
jgi:opacity protein-like surface antigen